MYFNARSLTIDTSKHAQEALSQIGCQAQGLKIMVPKSIFKVIKLEGLLAKEANLLKQTFLAKGGEVAIAKGCADLSIMKSDVLVCATLKQYQAALIQLKNQPWGLPAIASEIEKVLQGTINDVSRSYSFSTCQLRLQPYHTSIMGILNITPDSFSDGGKFNHLEAALAHMRQLVGDGADIIDLGAESTRPYGSSLVSAEEETQRLLPVLKEVVKQCPVPISIDTYKASVAEEALQAGAHILNDIWGLQGDPHMAEVAATYHVPIVIMHNSHSHDYKADIMGEIIRFLHNSIEIGLKAGMDFSQFIVDPGIGFAKIPAQNLVIMSRLDELKALGCPILLGTSRKRFIGEVLNVPVEDRVEGTGATVAVGIMKGAQIVRVHDVKPIARIAKMTDYMMRRDNNA
ncbi:dihydropteroate synthase [Sporomusaceae bacterium BoRhaA]|uniref:dihydropteroate synthase n=1 Tax=Pelorhabdus rhamnosifermentans TaxID=2772457 RepID=UPI001C061C3D|nr:dihydropteroate synthase [Pelorhabdus rhamnosifermentans]MBU2702028.1 dihydropteroate synthase [Pelorhabdus rhamnosifermentans]